MDIDKLELFNKYEEAIRILKDEIEYQDFSKAPDSLIMALNIAIEALEKQLNNKWTPIAEKLPETAGEYLVTYQPCYWKQVNYETLVGLDTFRGKTAWAKEKYQHIIAWMPKPEQYNVEISTTNL